MIYNPLYGRVPYLAGGGEIAFYRGGSGFRTWINNTGNWWRGSHSVSQNHQFRNAVDYLLDRGYTIDEVQRLLNEGKLEDVDMSNLYGGEGGGHEMNNTERIWINRMIAHADKTGTNKNTLIENYKNTHKNRFGGASGDDGSTEEVDGDTEEVDGDTETPEEETPETGGSTGSSGGGPTEITDMGDSGSGADTQQQTVDANLEALLQAYRKIQEYLAQQNANQQGQQAQEQTQPSQTYSGPNVSVGDLFGMDRWQLRQLHRGRDVRLANGETVSPTSRWSGRHLAHDIRTERRHDRRGARRDYMAQYYNPARKARYEGRAANRNDREASHYVNIGQYVSPYTEK